MYTFSLYVCICVSKRIVKRQSTLMLFRVNRESLFEVIQEFDIKYFKNFIIYFSYNEKEGERKELCKKKKTISIVCILLLYN